MAAGIDDHDVGRVIYLVAIRVGTAVFVQQRYLGERHVDLLAECAKGLELTAKIEALPARRTDAEITALAKLFPAYARVPWSTLMPRVGCS